MASDGTYAEEFKSAKSLYEKGYYVKSQEACEKLIAQQPENVNGILLLSASYYMQGRYDNSLESLRTVPAKYRECAEVINNMAANLFLKENYSEACRAFYSAVCKKPSFMECWISYIVTCVKMNSYEDVFTALQIMINYEPNQPKPYYIYGYVLIKLGRFDEARGKFQAAIQLDPKSDASWTGLADCFAFKNNFHTAIVCYEKAVEINKSAVYPLVNLGFMHYLIKQFDKSTSILKSAIQLEPTLNYNTSSTLANTFPHNEVLYDVGINYLNHRNNAAAAIEYFKLYDDLDK